MRRSSKLAPSSGSGIRDLGLKRMRLARRTEAIAGFALFMNCLIYALVIPLVPHPPAMGTNEELGLLYGAIRTGCSWQHAIYQTPHFNCE